MADSLTPRWRYAVPLVLILLAGLGTVAFVLWLSPGLPGPGSPRYERYLEDFQVGEAAADTEQLNLALAKLSSAIETVPEEPAAWADRGLVYLRLGRLDEAARDLAEAHRLAPDSPEVEVLLGYLADARGRVDEAADHFRKGHAARPRDLRTLYALAQAVEKKGDAAGDEEYRRLIEQGLEADPYNYWLLRDRLLAALRHNDRATLDDTLARYRKLAPNWSGESARHAVEALDKLEQAAKAGPDARLERLAAALDNPLKEQRGYQRSARALQEDINRPKGDVVGRFLRLAPPRPTPAPPDLALRFSSAAPAGEVQGRWDVALPVWLARQSPPAVFVANGREARRADANAPALPFPGGAQHAAPSAAGVVPLDWNNDFRTDLLLAGAGGLRFFQAGPDGTFADVTARTGLPAELLGADYHGAWAADYDMDGDVDLVAAPRAGPPLVLRNNGDGTFKPLRPFAAVDGVRAFAWADLDNDGAPDAAFVDAAGRLHVFANERMGQFRARPLPDLGGTVLALAVADVNDDGAFDLLALRADGAVLRVSDRDKGQGWDVAELARWDDLPAGPAPGSLRLLAADLDNNGAADLLACGPAGGRAWLADGRGRFQALPADIPPAVFAAVDLTDDGRLDLLALSPEGRPVFRASEGTKSYAWQVVWPEAVDKEKERAQGDSRINSFALGGEVEVRTGRLVQKVPITAPAVHLGLGEAKKAQVLRIMWPNGTWQVEFEQPADTRVVALQRLKGSCPFLFAYDGTAVRFVTDFMWSTPLGMYINAQDKGGFLQTEDWVKIRGDQLAPRDGTYDLRVNANLWETHYYDHMRLRVVDHPPGTEIYVDERFFLTPTRPQVFVTAPPRPVARARDHQGRDVTEVVRHLDGRHLDCGRGRFQGVAPDHWVEVDLGDDAPARGPLWLLATGFVHPTDSSINFALEQGTHDGPRGLVLEVPDGKGGWKVGRPALGFPAGKNKTILLRLDGIDGPGVARRFRLRTNMEVYWDALAYATGLDDSLARIQDLAPDEADLRYRGVLEMSRPDDCSPEIPDYEKVVGRRQYWRDLIGYYTRFGDVRELLAQVDDRYAILNAGDEIAFRFRAPDGPPPGLEA